MKQATRDKLLQLGARPLIAAMARRGLKNRVSRKLPVTDPFAGEACTTIEACREGSVLLLERPIARLPDRLRQRLAGVVTRRDLGGASLEAGDVILRDRDCLLTIPAALAEAVAEEAAEAIAFEDFTAEQVNQGGGVYGLHIPSGERARQAFAQWRKLKGR